MTRVVIECADNLAFMGGLDDGAFKLIVTSPPCNLGKASLAAKPEQRVVEIVHPSYQPSKVALEEDMRVDARFEEAVDALAQPVSTRHIARPKPGHQAASGTFLHNPPNFHPCFTTSMNTILPATAWRGVPAPMSWRISNERLWSAT